MCCTLSLRLGSDRHALEIEIQRGCGAGPPVHGYFFNKPLIILTV